MADNIKIRAQIKSDGITEIKLLLSHPMETGRRKSDFGDLIPAHFIQQLSAYLNQQLVLEAQWGTGVSKNPYLTFYLSQAKLGDVITIKWLDNRGQQGQGEMAIR